MFCRTRARVIVLNCFYISFFCKSIFPDISRRLSVASSINVKLEEGEEEGEEKVVVEEVDISSVQAREGLLLNNA